MCNAKASCKLLPGLKTSTRSCTPAGSCTGDYLKEKPCQKETLHIEDNGDLEDVSETCMSAEFGQDGHCVCPRGERVVRMQSNFELASTDMIWNLQCREIAHQLEVTLSYCQRLCEFHHIAYRTSSAKLFAQISIIDALFKACRRKVDKRNSGIRTRGTF